MENEKMIRVHLTISGIVQGVFFRAHAQDKARQLGVTGWVANEGDGTVNIIVEGPENQVNALIDWCHGGPSMSQVENVKAEYEPYMGEFQDFNVRF